jgi:AraC-like DNA-binding protein
MANRIHLPCDILKPYVQNFIISESTPETTYRVLPDTGVVLGFQFKGRLSHLAEDKEIKLSTSGITGLRDTYRVFKNSPDTGTVLVLFRAGGAAAFFRQPIHELFNESVSLDNFILRSRLLMFEGQLSEAGTHPEKIKVVEHFLISQMRHTETDKLVVAALGLIHKSKGNIRVRQLMDQLNISQSPLEKRFRQVVGTSPKKYASLVRFKHTINSYNPDNSLTALGYEAGFYDQAHFIKEFRNFTGETPESFFSKDQ